MRTASETMSSTPRRIAAPVPENPAVDVVAGLIAALTRPDLYRLIERDGELFVEPVEAGEAAARPM